ncbi:MAG: DUF6290 family protein [Candidatus Ratteibacteria bacterium]|jgi:hypothetical protein
MAKTITLRLTEEEYKMIRAAAGVENRPISNFITTKVVENIEESYFVDPVEMAQIKSDKGLLGKLKAGHRDAEKMRGKFVG